MDLPLHYSIVKPLFLRNDERLRLPATESTVVVEERTSHPLRQEEEWLLNAITEEDSLPWSVFRSRRWPTYDEELTRTAVLPLLTEEAHTVAMMVHSMDVVAAATKFLNPQQTPVIVLDQQLYAISRQIQISPPETHGEKNFFLMMGGLHVEMAALHAVGKWLDGSGWIGIVVEANVTTPGRANSVLNASHVTRTRYIHQVRRLLKTLIKAMHPHKQIQTSMCVTVSF